MTPNKFIALMLTTWVGVVVGDAVYFRFLVDPIKGLRG